MNDANSRKYLETQISTASPDQLLLMLYDGAIRFLGKAREAVQNEEVMAAHENLLRTQKIVIELVCALNREMAPELSQNLSSLYIYMYEKLVEANIEKNIDKINEVTDLLVTLRSGWREAVKVVRGEQPPTGTSPNPPVGGGGISLSG